MDHIEWKELSRGFRKRIEILARALRDRRLRIPRKASYLSGHSWSSGGPIWEELRRQVGYGAFLVSSVDQVVSEQRAPLLVVDPAFVFTKDTVIELCRWARSGSILAIPRSHLYSKAARRALESVMEGADDRMDLNMGISYSVYHFGEGKVVVYEAPENVHAEIELTHSWKKFIQSLVSLGEGQPFCKLTDDRLSCIPFQSTIGASTSSHRPTGLFVLNPLQESISTEIEFQDLVTVFDMAQLLSGGARSAASASQEPGRRFSLEVPPCGVLPIAVELVDAELPAEHSISEEEASLETEVQPASSSSQVKQMRLQFGQGV